MSKTMDTSGGAPSPSSRVDLKCTCDLLGGTEAELRKLFDGCQNSAISPSQLRGCDWATPRVFTKGVYAAPSLSELRKAHEEAMAAATLRTWTHSMVSDECASTSGGHDAVVTTTFAVEVEPHGAKSFWQQANGGRVLSSDCFHNTAAHYTVLHTDDYGAASIGQLEGHGGFKIWFVFSPTRGKTLVGQDEFQPLMDSGIPWFRGVYRVATEVLKLKKGAWVLVQQPGDTVFIPPNFYHSVLTVPERGVAMELFLIGETRMHPDKVIARQKAEVWLTKYSRGDHNGHHRGDKDDKWARLDELCPRSSLPASGRKKRLKIKQ
jgi:hypothetical protein